MKDLQTNDNLNSIHPNFIHQKNASKILYEFREDIAKRNDKLLNMSQSYAFGSHDQKSQYPQTISIDDDPIMVNDFEEFDINGNLNLKSSYDYTTQKLEQIKQ